MFPSKLYQLNHHFCFPNTPFQSYEFRLEKLTHLQIHINIVRVYWENVSDFFQAYWSFWFLNIPFYKFSV